MLLVWKYIGWPVVAVAICLTFAGAVMQPVFDRLDAVTSTLGGVR
jgi:hypothetical protein